MTQELAQITNDKDFILALNNETGFSNKAKYPKLVKFDAVDGVWVISQEEKDEANKTVFQALGKEIEVHIVNNRKMAQFKEGDKIIAYSREYQDNFVELLDVNSNEIVDKGFYKDLKAKYGDSLIFTQILYVFYKDELCRVRLAGGKLSKWFDYVASFQNDSLARYITKLKCGQFIEKTKMVKYYEIEIEKGALITNRELIIKRVNDANVYLNAYINSLKVKQMELKPVYKGDDWDNPIPADEVVIENIPF